MQILSAQPANSKQWHAGEAAQRQLYGAQRLRHSKAYNMDLLGETGRPQMPSEQGTLHESSAARGPQQAGTLDSLLKAAALDLRASHPGTLQGEPQRGPVSTSRRAERAQGLQAGLSIERLL